MTSQVETVLASYRSGHLLLSVTDCCSRRQLEPSALQNSTPKETHLSSFRINERLRWAPCLLHSVQVIFSCPSPSCSGSYSYSYSSSGPGSLPQREPSKREHPNSMVRPVVRVCWAPRAQPTGEGETRKILLAAAARRKVTMEEAGHMVRIRRSQKDQYSRRIQYPTEDAVHFLVRFLEIFTSVRMCPHSSLVESSPLLRESQCIRSLLPQVENRTIVQGHTLSSMNRIA